MSMQVAAPPPHAAPGNWRHFLTIARRNLLHIKSDPQQLVGMTIQPLMFLMLFVYVFGGAIAGSSHDYLQFALPGILVQGVAFTSLMTALGLNRDFDNGLIDRFRSLPIGRAALIGGRVLADTARVVWGTLMIVAFGMLLGFRFEGEPLSAAAGVALVILFGFTMCWPMAFVGVSAKSPESVQTGAFLLILPLTFASSVFARPETMPGWLQAFVDVNPMTKVVDAARGLMLQGPIADPLFAAALWMVGITVVSGFLAVARYRLRI